MADYTVTLDDGREVTVGGQKTMEAAYAVAEEWATANPDVKPVEAPGDFDGITSFAQQGMTLGIADEVGAAGGALGAYIRGLVTGEDVTLGGEFDRIIAGDRAKLNAYRSENPWTAITAEVAGSLGLGGVVNGLYKHAPKIFGQGAIRGPLGKSTVVGAEIGGGAGFGHGEGNLVERIPGTAIGTAIGAGLGLGLPPALAVVGGLTKPIYRAVTDRVRMFGAGGPKNAFERKLQQALDEGGMTPEQAKANLRQIGPEATMADLDNPAVGALAEQIALPSGPGRTAAESTLRGRATTQPQRIETALNKATGTRETGHQASGRLTEARQQAATAGYDEANAAVPHLPADDVAEVLASSPHYRSAMSEAKAFPEWYNLPDTDMRLWDQVYKILGARSRNVMSGDDGVARHNFGTMQRMLGEFIGEFNPRYMEAVAKFADDSALMDAVTAGRSVLTVEAEVGSEMVAAMSEVQRNAYIVGVRQAIQTNLEKVGAGGNAATKLVNKPYVRKRLQAAFGGGQPNRGASDALADRQARNKFDAFKKTMNAEHRMSVTKNRMIDGSDTARRTASLGEGGLDPQPLVEVAQGNVRGGAAGVGRNLLQKILRPPSAVREQGAAMFSNNQALNMRLLNDLQRRSALRQQRESVGSLNIPAIIRAEQQQGPMIPNILRDRLNNSLQSRLPPAIAAQLLGGAK